MTKNRVYGEQVLVRVMSNNGQHPYILDFDSIEIQSFTINKSYKGIGKKVTRTQSINTGYKIVLTRAKRDNYLQALINYNDFHIQKGLEPPVFMIDYIINHNYSEKSINYESELNDNFKTPNPYQLKPIERPSNALTDTIFKVAETALRRNQFIAKLQDSVRDVSKKANTVNNLINTVQDIFTPNNKNIKDTEEYKKMMELNAKLAGESFKENYKYLNCTIGEFSSNDSPRNNSVETITLYATHRDNFNDNNIYEDEYMVEKVKTDSIDRTNNHIDLSIYNNNKNNNPTSPNIEKAFRDSMYSSFEEIYGNLF